MGLFDSFALDLVGGLIGASGAKKAAKERSRALDQQIALLRQATDQNRSDFQPYTQAGSSAINALASLFGLSGQAPDYNQLLNTPGYKFRLEEGYKALENSAASRGRLLSGAQIKAAQKYGQNYASEEYAKYADRLAQMAGLGLNATGDMAGLNTGLAGQQGSATAGIGDARGSAYEASANALRDSISLRRQP